MLTARIDSCFTEKDHGFLSELRDGRLHTHLLRYANIFSRTPRRDYIAYFASVVGDRSSFAINLNIFESTVEIQKWPAAESLGEAIQTAPGVHHE